MTKIPFQDGTKTQEAYVTIDEQNYQVTPATWTGNTPLKAQNLNKMQDNIEEAINVQRATVTLESTVNANTNYNLPTGIYYEVGNDSLEINYCGSKLIKRTRLQRNRNSRRSIKHNTVLRLSRRFRYVRRRWI